MFGLFTLPPVPGKYPVGATTFAVPVTGVTDEARVIGSAKLKSTSGAEAGTPALQLEEAAFTVFYPADTSSVKPRPGVANWVPRPVGGILRGYAHFGGLGFLQRFFIFLFGSFARFLKFTAYTNAGLLDPKLRSGKPGEPWPLIIFSHGLAGTRTSYTYLCSRLASEGNVVLALEHRDGTGPFVMTRSPIPGMGAKQGARPILYLNPDDVDGKTQDRFAFRDQQLLFRRLEIYLAYTAFKQLVTTTYDTSLDRPDIQRMHTIDGPWNFKLEARKVDKRFWQSWEHGEGPPKVQCDANVCLAGHSFGAATLLSLLTNPPPSLDKHTFNHLPVSHAIALDPWVEPLATLGPAPLAAQSSLQDRHGVTPRLLVINSEAFTLWQEHFPKLMEIVKLWNQDCGDTNYGIRARLFTIVRSKHISFSDFGVFFSFGRVGEEGRKYLDTIFALCLGHLRGNLQSALHSQIIASGELKTYEKNGRERHRLTGDSGDIVIHV